MKNISKVLMVCFVLATFTQCKKSGGNTPTPVDPVTTHADDFPAVDNSTPTNVNIAWDNTDKKVSHTVYFAEYPRVLKLGGDSLYLVYHCGTAGNEWDNIAIRKSYDGGANWTAAEIIVADNNANYYGFANPQLTLLQNGWILLAYTGKGNPDDNLHDNIQVRISKDRGQTWGTPVIAATGRSWEPATVQLPNGEIEMMFSSEAAWWPSSDVQQEIRMATSTSNGESWAASKRVAYTTGKRDGMATPILLKDGKGILFPIESVNNSQAPWMVWSSLEAKWDYASTASTSNARRWLGTTQNIWGGAPFLVQTTSGEIILAVQDAGGRTVGSDWKKNTMLVMIGNSIAKNFTNVTQPWPALPANEGAYYTTLSMKDNNTILAFATRNFSDGHSEIYMKTGHITR